MMVSRVTIYIAASLTAASLNACLCGGVPILNRSTFDRSPEVFEGIVVAKSVSFQREYGFFLPRVRSTIAPEHIWKGNNFDRITIVEDSSDCGMQFSAGERYLVVSGYYDPVTSEVFASGCSPTFLVQKLEQVNEVSSEFGAPIFTRSRRGNRPGEFAKAEYYARTYFMSGLVVVLNLTLTSEGRTSGMAPVSIFWLNAVLLFAGIAVASALLVGAFRRRRLPGSVAVRVGSAVTVILLTLVLAGYFYCRSPWVNRVVAWKIDASPAAPE